MKKIYLAALAILWIGAAFYACKKAGEGNNNFNDPQGNAKASRALLACTYETLSGNITADRTLSSAIVYKIDGCVTVKTGVTLTIPAGTILQGMKTPSAGGKSFLIAERGAKITAIGTATNPIIFTSDQLAGSRNPGDWGGLRFFGNASNNAGTLNIDLGCAIYPGGGTNDADNSGTLQYVQIHFAGAIGTASDISRAGLFLNSVGTGTTIDHIQVSNSLNDGFAVFGGKVKLNNLVSYKAQRMDYQLSFGYQGNLQYLAAMRLSATPAPVTQVYGMNISNNISSASTSTPLTMPVISNLTIMGPNYCGATGVSLNFHYAIRFFNNGSGKIYNTVLSSWNNKGLLIDGTNSVGQTGTNNIEFSYNSIHNSSTPFGAVAPLGWVASGGCGASIAAWITGTSPAACKEAGNEFSVATLGYNSSFCDDYCAGGFNQDFTLGATTLSAPNYSWDTASAFDHVAYRGSFGATDFTQNWTEWCAGNNPYCQ